MNAKVYQMLYCSRNRIQGTDAELQDQIRSILDASRTNNAVAGVTGALFYNTVFFAQVLEGAFVDVQRTFERLQLDPRHGDLVVLQSGYVTERDFADWSMADAGAPENMEMLTSFPMGKFSTFSLKAQQVSSFLRAVVVQQENWALPARTAAVRL